MAVIMKTFEQRDSEGYNSNKVHDRYPNYSRHCPLIHHRFLDFYKKNRHLIGPQYNKDIIEQLREVASPRGAGLTFTLFLGLGSRFIFIILQDYKLYKTTKIFCIIVTQGFGLGMVVIKNYYRGNPMVIILIADRPLSRLSPSQPALTS